jgi:GTPase
VHNALQFPPDHSISLTFLFAATVAGMTGSLPDYALLVVGANMGVTHMTKEYYLLFS